MPRQRPSDVWRRPSPPQPAGCGHLYRRRALGRQDAELWLEQVPPLPALECLLAGLLEDDVSCP
jgi:hypothetical protein